MDHLAPSSGVNWYTSYNAFGELLAATPQLPPMELGGVDVGRPYNPQSNMHYPTQVGGLHYGQETLNHPSVVMEEEYLCHEKTLPPAQSKAFSQVRVLVGEKIACQECGATFACSANLRNHMRIHTGERPFVCEECGASFTQRSNMRSHKRVHTGERPYMCGICGQTFARSSHLPGHMRTHTGEKPFSCPHCGRSFATNQIRKNHMRTHTGERPFICDICDATFAQSSCLATHKKIHTGERNFKCGKCGKAFISRSGLQTHERVHTGEKPYNCERCDKSFRTSSYLSKHRRKYCGNEASEKINRKPGSNKTVKKSASPHKLNKYKMTVKQTDRPPSKRSRVKRLQHLKQSKKSLCKCESSSKPELCNELEEEEVGVKTRNYLKREICDAEDANITTAVPAVETSIETLRAAYGQEENVHPSRENTTSESKSDLLGNQALTGPHEEVSLKREDLGIKVEEQSFAQESAHVEDEGRRIIPQDRFIGSGDEVLEVSCLQRDNLHNIEPVKQTYEEVKPFAKSHCSFSDSHPQDLQLQDQVTRTQHQLIENYFKEIESPGFSESAYEAMQSPPLMDVQQVCEEIPQLTTKPSEVPQQAYVVKDDPTLWYSRSYI